MPTYSQYIAAIDGKTFSSKNIFLAFYQRETTGTSSGMTTYEGQGGNITGQSAIAGTVSAVDANAGTFSLGGTTYQVHGSTLDGNDLFFQAPGGRLYLLVNPGTTPASDPVGYSTGNSYNAPNPACFAEGTNISTHRGAVTVEQLRVGDMVRTKSGDYRPVVWIGRRAVKCEGHPWRDRMLPYVVVRDAIAPGVPSRDVLFSHGHGIAMGEYLIQVDRLENGRTIYRKDVDAITYWHFELDRHDIVFADGMEVESFIDCGNRNGFEGESGRLYEPNFAEEALARYCRPIAGDAFAEQARTALEMRADYVMGRQNLAAA